MKVLNNRQLPALRAGTAIEITRQLLRLGKPLAWIAQEVAVIPKQFRAWSGGRYGKQSIRIDALVTQRFKRLRCPETGIEMLAHQCETVGGGLDSCRACKYRRGGN